MIDPRENFLAKAFQFFQENVRRSGPAAAASYALITAILLFGVIGYLLDRWRGTSPWFLLAGVFIGMIVGFYGLAKAIWKQ